MQLHVRLCLTFIGVALLFVSGQAALAVPTTLWVNNAHGPYTPTGNSCDNPNFPTIQSAVDAALPGTRINVCPGTYVEATPTHMGVLIPAGKDNLVLRSTAIWQAIIKAPPDNPADTTKAVVRVNGAHNTTILAFTISGPGSGLCNSLRYGVRVDNSGSANVSGNHIIDIRDNDPMPPSGCQNGVAVLVGRNFEGTTGTANIVGNVFERYQKNGPTVDNTGSSAYIAANRVLGFGPTLKIAQNGIQVSRGASARIEQNLVANHIYTPTPLSTGLLFFQADSVTATRNSVARNDFGIFSDLSTATTSMTQNTVQTSTSDGFVIQGVSNESVAQNATERNGGQGIGLYDDGTPASNNTIASNDVEQNKGSGVLLDVATANNVNGNHVRANGTAGMDTDGMRANETATNNTIQNNFMKNNVTLDCHDKSHGTGTAMTANFWINDRGDTQSPPGICRPSQTDDQDDRNDQTASMQVRMNAGWDPNYAWYATDPLASEYTDWAANYASVDTQSVLSLQAVLNTLPTRPHATPGD